MANVDILPTSVVEVDDRAGSHYKIYTIYHTAGDNTDILVDNSVVSAAALVPNASETAATVAINADDNATDAVREITVTSSTSGYKTIVARFVGSGAGMGSGKFDL